jgi:hypothetical protein
LASPATVSAIAREFEKRILTNDLTRWQYEPPGFSCWIYLHALDAARAVNNYSKPEIKRIEGNTPERFLEHEVEELGCPHCAVESFAGGAAVTRAVTNKAIS